MTTEVLHTPPWRMGILLAATLLRCLVGLSSYSGAHDHPKYGDYEAQRHWMELTINTPVRAWYTPSLDRDPTYWPLDYPPLSGYQSWLHGKFMSYYEPAVVALGTSKGYETPSSKLLMRYTVLLSDWLVLFPAVLWAVKVFCKGHVDTVHAYTLAVVLLQPAAVLIDHAHFQFNGISLGLTAAAAAAIGAGRPLLGAALYTSALHHKQMSLFYAPAFFGHLLGRCLQQPTPARKAVLFLSLGATVLATSALCWAPYLHSPPAALGVLQRIFPVRRGLFEDYLANFWCVSSVVFKWRDLASNALLMRACAGLTLAAAAPSMVQQVRAPSPRGLLLAMANSAMAFFMFSYQVHEKSILLPLMPITLLAYDMPYLATWLPLMACFSMFPLLERDGATLAYLGSQLVFSGLLYGTLQGGGPLQPTSAGVEVRRGGLMSLCDGFFGWLYRRRHLVAAATAVVAVAVHAARTLVPPPARLPWLHDRLCVTLAFAYFAAVMVYLNIQQWRTPSATAAQSGSQKTAPDKKSI